MCCISPCYKIVTLYFFPAACTNKTVSLYKLSCTPRQNLLRYNRKQIISRFARTEPWIYRGFMAKVFSFFSPKKSPAVTELSAEMFAFLEQYPLALLLIDATGHIIFANPSAVRLLQTDHNALISSYVDRFGLTMEKVRSMAQSTPPRKVVLELVNDQADSVFVGAAASFLASTPFILLTLESIPHFSKLTADNSFLRGLVNACPSAIVVQNLSGVCVLWSDQAAKLFGYQQSDVLGQDIYAFLPKGLVSSLQHVDDKILQERASQEPFNLIYTNADNQEVVLLVTKIFLPAEAGKDMRILTLFEDITQRHHYEQDLLQNRTLLRAVLENVPLGLYTRDCEDKITFYNRQSLKVLNENNEENVGRAHPYQTADDTAMHKRREQEILRDGKIRDYPTEEYTDSQGNKRILHLRKVPLMDAGPKPLVLSIVEDITEQITRAKEIERANALLYAIVHNLPLGVYARNMEGKVILSNSRSADMFDEEELMPSLGSSTTTFAEKENPEQLQKYLSREREVLESGQIKYIPEEVYQMPDGTVKTLSLVKVPVKGDSDATSFVLSVVDDITQRKAQEKDLLDTKNFLQTVLDNTPVAIYARGINQTMRFVNRRAMELFPGEEEEEKPEGNDFYDQRELSIIEKKQTVDIPEERYTTLEGKELILHLVKVPLVDQEGKVFMILTVAEDITQRKAQEEEIVNAKNFLQAVINNLPVSLSVKDYAGKYILWNKKSEELFGASSKDMIGRSSYRADVNEEQLEFLRESDLKVFESKKEQNIPQELISTPNEGVKIMHTVKTPVFNEDGTPNCLVVVSEDITAQTRMEKQIREASDKNTLLIENAREGILLAEDRKVMYANLALCRMLGYGDVKEIIGTPLIDLAGDDYKDVLKEKYESVISDSQKTDETISLSLHKKNGQPVEVEFAAMASRYLGRRIVLCFVRDITTFNHTQRDLLRERDSYRSAFEKAAVPSFILLSNGYISLMNASCRALFGFKDTDKTFYRNVYVRPGLTLDVRRKLRAGESAHMDYTFQFSRMAPKFPGRLDSTKADLPLHLMFEPINRRDAKDGTVSSDYIVSITTDGRNLPQEIPNVKLLRKPLPPTQILPAVAAREMLILPNSEPYVLCSADFKMISCNELFCELCQLSEQELIGQFISHIIDEGSLSQFEADLRTLAKEGTLSNRDYCINPASGLEKITVRLTGVKEEGGHYLFVLRNQTVHVQLMKVLEERSAQLNALLASTNGVVFSILLNKGKFGGIDNVSQYLSQKTGYTQDELTRMQFEDLFLDTKTVKKKALLSKAQKQLAEKDTTTFVGTIACKDGSRFEAQVTITALDLPGQEGALVVLRDVSEERDIWSRTSKEAQELQSVRSALPGMYLKTDSAGKVQEVYSNLEYLPQEEANQLFLGKKPAQFWSKEAAQRAMFTIKEALSINVATNFDLEWKTQNMTRYFDVSVTPIAGRGEVILWLKDISQGHTHEEQVKQLYTLTSEPGLSMTQQVDKILEFGLKTFHADIGFVLRFVREGEKLMSHIMYVTSNDMALERSMAFPIEECLYDVADGRVLVWPDLAGLACHNCVHIKKNFGALLAAPLFVNGKVMGALCFASTSARKTFESGTEELMGLLGQMLAVRIELRQTGKLLSEASRSFARTLEYVDKPAALLDLDYQITFINDPLLSYTGRHISNMMGRDFFEELVRNADLSKRSFHEAAHQAQGNAFTITLEVRNKKGSYEDINWRVVLCKDDSGEIASYGLLEVE